MVFTPENAARAREIVARYPFSRSAVLPLLHLAQDQDGWVRPDALREVADLLGLERAQVLGTCSFYTMFKREPVGRLVISVCTNVSCLVNRGPELLEHLAERYADVDDVLVEEVECIAACDRAPVLQVNYEFLDGADFDAAERAIDEYRSGHRVARGVSGGRGRS